MLNSRIRKNVARAAALLAASTAIAVAAPTAAHAACVPVMDVTAYPPYFDSATLNTTSGQINYTWGGSGWVSNSGCIGTVSVYLRLTDRSIAPAMPTVGTGWVLLETDSNPDGGDYGYRGGDTTMSVVYRDNWTAAMRGTLGQITAETKAVFVASGGPTTTICNAYTKTFTSTPTAPQVLSETPDTCLP